MPDSFPFLPRLAVRGPWARPATQNTTPAVFFYLVYAPPPNQYWHNMYMQMQVVRRVTDRPERDLVPVDSGYGTPPALEGQSCLYVLRYSSLLNGGDRDKGAGAGGRHPSAEAVLPAAGATTYPAINEVGAGGASARSSSSLPAPAGEEEEEAGVWFYVGESDAIRERLKQHARRWGGGSGSSSGSGSGKAFKLDAVVVAVENRSEARRLETAVILAMKEEGFHLVSDNDGSRTHFSSSKIE